MDVRISSQMNRFFRIIQTGFKEIVDVGEVIIDAAEVLKEPLPLKKGK